MADPLSQGAGWTFTDVAFDEAAYDIKGRETEAATALLLGRRSYDEFSPVWPSMEDFATYNAVPKYVVSTTLPGDTAPWGEGHVDVFREPGRPLPPARLPETARQRQAPLRRGRRPRQDHARPRRARRLLQRDHPPALRRRPLTVNALA